MENEKKQNPSADGKEQSHKKNHHGRRRGYFIEPARKTEGAPRPITPQPKQETGEGKSAGGGQKSRHGRHGGGGQQKNSRAKPQAQEQKQPQAAPQPPKEAPHPAAPAKAGEPFETSGAGGGQNRRRRNRHRGGKPAEAKEPALNGEQTLAPRKEEGAQQKKRQPQSGGDRGGKQNRRSSDRLIVTPPPKESTPAFNDSDYEEVRFPATEELSFPESPAEQEPVPMVEVVGVRFKSSGKTYYFDPAGQTVRRGEFAIVETARGQEYGEVSLGNTMVKESDTVPPLRPILRVATAADKQHQADNKAKEEDAFRICNEKIAAHGLDMKLIDAQYTFDNTKLLFYFTSAGRVDFRELVKDLASVFRTRIELRQIGIRDEAKLMGGMGMCGRPLCCTLFLSDFGQVSIKMAKEQNLSLNSAKISGICGRLMCCLRYEHEAYEYEIKRTPPVDSLVRTADGNGVVTEINPLVGTIKVRLLGTPDTPPKFYRREDVVMLQKKKKNDPVSE